MSFINTYVNGCIPPLAQLSSPNCSIPTLGFTFNFYTSNLMNNVFQNTKDSLKQGITSTAVFKLKSLDTNFSGFDFTLQGLRNSVAENPSITTQLYVTCWTILATDTITSSTVGTINFETAYANPKPKPNEPYNQTRISPVTTFISSACGVFSSYRYGRAELNFDDVSNNRIFYIYPN